MSLDSVSEFFSPEPEKPPHEQLYAQAALNYTQKLFARYKSAQLGIADIERALGKTVDWSEWLVQSLGATALQEHAWQQLLPASLPPPENQLDVTRATSQPLLPANLEWATAQAALQTELPPNLRADYGLSQYQELRSFYTQLLQAATCTREGYPAPNPRTLVSTQEEWEEMLDTAILQLYPAHGRPQFSLRLDVPAPYDEGYLHQNEYGEVSVMDSAGLPLPSQQNSNPDLDSVTYLVVDPYQNTHLASALYQNPTVLREYWQDFVYDRQRQKMRTLNALFRRIAEQKELKAKLEVEAYNENPRAIWWTRLADATRFAQQGWMTEHAAQYALADARDESGTIANGDRLLSEDLVDWEVVEEWPLTVSLVVSAASKKNDPQPSPVLELHHFDLRFDADLGLVIRPSYQPVTDGTLEEKMPGGSTFWVKADMERGLLYKDEEHAAQDWQLLRHLGGSSYNPTLELDQLWKLFSCMQTVRKQDVSAGEERAKQAVEQGMQVLAQAESLSEFVQLAQEHGFLQDGYALHIRPWNAPQFMFRME